MTREEILQEFSDINHVYNNCTRYDTLKRMIDELTEPCNDAISREWLKNAIHNFYYGLAHTPTEEDIQAYIDAAPPVTPQTKTGHWYKKELPNGHWICSCSKCNYNGRFEWIACPNCGAKMESEE